MAAVAERQPEPRSATMAGPRPTLSRPPAPAWPWTPAPKTFGSMTTAVGINSFNPMKKLICALLMAAAIACFAGPNPVLQNSATTNQTPIAALATNAQYLVDNNGNSILTTIATNFAPNFDFSKMWVTNTGEPNGDGWVYYNSAMGYYTNLYTCVGISSALGILIGPTPLDDTGVNVYYYDNASSATFQILAATAN